MRSRELRHTIHQLRLVACKVGHTQRKGQRCGEYDHGGVNRAAATGLTGLWWQCTLAPAMPVTKVVTSDEIDNSGVSKLYTLVLVTYRASEAFCCVQVRREACAHMQHVYVIRSALKAFPA